MPTTRSNTVQIIGNLAVYTQTTTGAGPPTVEGFYETDGNMTPGQLITELNAAKAQRQAEITIIDAVLGAPLLHKTKGRGRRQ